MTQKRSVPPVMLAVFLAAIVLFVVSACGKNRSPRLPLRCDGQPGAGRPPMMTADPAVRDSGQGRRGDVGRRRRRSTGAVTVSYHFFLIREQAFDRAFGPRIAPSPRLSPRSR